MFRKILIANDGSEGAFKALTAALDLARHYKAELHMISVEELPRFPTTIDEVIEEKDEANRVFGKVIDRSKQLAKLKRIKIHPHVIAGHAVKSICEFIEAHGFDLLVIGFMGHSALWNRAVGSTTDRLVDPAPCGVLVIK